MRPRNILILLAILLVLGGYFYFANAPQPAAKAESKVFAWSINEDDIKHIKIELPREDKSQTFIKIPEGDKFPWYFDDPQRSPVNSEKWGGGIPLLLSGPGIDRLIARNATQEKLAELGLTQPSMKITLTLEAGNILNITVGDKTPDGNNFYVQIPDSNDVATVDISWYQVIEGMVTDPSYYATPPAD